jgi:hypothetical protein
MTVKFWFPKHVDFQQAPDKQIHVVLRPAPTNGDFDA